MIHIDTEGKEAARFYGRIVCDWEPEAAREYLRMTLYEYIRARVEESKAAGREAPDDARIQRYVESHVEHAMIFVVRHAAVAFAQAQGKLLMDALRITLSHAGGDKVTNDERKDDAAKLRREFNELIGVHPGRKAGQKISKPSEAMEHRDEILTAMRGVYESDPLHDPTRRRVAAWIGKSVRQLRNWMKEITKETGEEWEDLIVEAVQKRKF